MSDWQSTSSDGAAIVQGLSGSNLTSNNGGSSGAKRKSDYWCSSKKETVEINFHWTLENFQFQYYSTAVGEAIKSPHFSAIGDDTVVWYLEFFPHGEEEAAATEDSYSQVFLILVSSNLPKLVVRFSLHPDTGIPNSSIDADADNYRGFFLVTYNSESDNFGNPKFLSKSNLLDLFGNPAFEDKISIHCHIEYELTGSNTTSLLCRPAKLKDHSTSGKKNVTADLEELLKKGQFSDITFQVGKKEFHAHRIILAARSPVFAAMFQHNMKEKLTGRLEIEDVRPKVFQALLHFIYTDQIESDESECVVKELLATSDKYHVDSLKVKCEEILATQLSIENCSEFLLLADLYSAAQLKEEALSYIRFHSAKVAATAGWKTMKESRPSLFCDISEALINISTRARTPHIVEKKKKNKKLR